MNSKKVKALRKLIGIKGNKKILQMKPNAMQRTAVLRHDGNHRVEDKTTYSYVHGPKMRIYKDLKKAYIRKDAVTTSALLQYFFQNREKIEQMELDLEANMNKEITEEQELKVERLSTIDPEHKQRLQETFDKGLKKYYKASVLDLSIEQLERLITLTKQEEGE